MNNLEKFNAAFTESFGIPVEQLPELVYQGIEAWDSVGHMQLIAALEDTFTSLDKGTQPIVKCAE